MYTLIRNPLRISVKFQVVSKAPGQLDAYIVRLMEDQRALPVDDVLGKSVVKAVNEELKQLKFKGKEGATAVIKPPPGSPAQRIMVVGMGKPPCTAESSRRATAAVIRQARSLHLHTVGTGVGGVLGATVGQTNVEGALLADYEFTKYKKGNKPDQLTYYLISANASERRQVSEFVRRGEVSSQAVNLARDLVNEPPSVMNPIQLAKTAKELARRSGLRAQVFGPREMRRLGLNATLAVSKGSDAPPQFIRLQYIPRGAKKHIALVGKGVTYDSGGINLKPSQGGMLEAMKMDMGGSAAVIAAMSVLKDLGVKVKVTAYVAATENLLGASAYKPGDVIRAYNGKTIEVGNTDAEGRLTLSDSLSYAVAKDKPDEIIDIATLTGAAEVALGQNIAALFSNNKRLTESLIEASGQTGELLWALPLHQPYNNLFKSSIADLNNVGPRWGGAITAALFLEHFVAKTPWAHIDIAGPAWSDNDSGYVKKGGTGYGVRLLLAYLQKQ
jgi:leucyl aminopeptidase